MPGLPPMYMDFYYRPLTEDVEELLARFQRTDSVRYEHFSALWRSMSFSDVFAGISSMGEMKRFCRVTLATASKYFLGPFSYQIRVGGLYLLYGFYNTQLATPPCRIRFALKDWHYIQTFLEESVHSRHYDVLYVLRKLFATKALQFVAIPHFLTFRKHRNRQKEPLCARFLGRTHRVQELVYSKPLLDEVSNVHILYRSMTRVVAEKTCFVSVTMDDFSQRIDNTAAEFVAWQDKNFPAESEEEDEGITLAASESTERAERIHSIKKKSYSCYNDAGRARRHRQAAGDAGSGSGSGTDQNTGSHRCRPPSLRARTWKMLEVREETTLNF